MVEKPLKIYDLRFTIPGREKGFRISDSGFGIPGREKGFRISDSGFRISDLRFGIPGIWYYSWLFILFFTVASAQDIKVTARVDSNNIKIGDWLGLHVEVLHRDGTSVTWPTIADSLQGFEIVNRSNIEMKKNGSDVLESTTFTITAFDSGQLVVPPLQFLYKVTGDTTTKSAESSPIPVFVHGVIVDTSKDIKDVKPPLSLSITFAELLPYIIAVIILAAITWLLMYIWKKKKRGESILPEAPRRPAHEIALEALRALESESLWQRGKTKEYYSQLTDIVRAYIEHRFDVKALEMVTDEIMSSQIISSLQKDVREPLNELLRIADYVKFAKFQPTPQETEKTMPAALKFVESTWRQAQVQPEPQLAEDGKV